MDKIEKEKLKQKFIQGNRWVEANTNDILIVLRELGYRKEEKKKGV